MGSVQTSTLYEQTAEKIANDSGKKLPQPKIKTSVSEDKVLIRDGKIEIKLKDKKSGENSAIIDPKNNHFINLNQTKGEIELDSIEFKKELIQDKKTLIRWTLSLNQLLRHVSCVLAFERH